MHLDKHFFGKPDLLGEILVGDDVAEKIALAITATDRAQSYSNYLLEWITPEQTAEEAINQIVRRLSE